MIIRHALITDLGTIMEIYKQAREFMARTGNPTQWGPTNWPPRELIEKDIASGCSYVCEEDDQIGAVFCFRTGEDPTYAEIDGKWIDDRSYGVVHRIASNHKLRGAGRYCIQWCYSQCGHLRMDTHPDNKIMQRLLEEEGFVRCGIIHVEEDDYPRLAYEKSSYMN